MLILSPDSWEDYELIDSGGGRRLERFGKYVLSRPDPQAIWSPQLKDEWSRADATFDKGNDGREKWVSRGMPEKWKMQYKELSFWARLTPFKHTGVFPEQAVHWNWMQEKIISSTRSVNVLNLFAYTGISSLAAAAAGAKVTHLDASKPTLNWAHENQEASGLTDKQIRWIPDDAIKFIQREVRRGVKYDGIIMDPPVYGHGPKGEIWDFNKDFPKLLANCRQLLSDNPVFVIVNAYAVSASSVMLQNILEDFVSDRTGKVESGELALKHSKSERLLSTGIFGRWASS